MATCRITHVFVDRDEITGVIDWSEAGQGDALYDLAIFSFATATRGSAGSSAASRTRSPMRTGPRAPLLPSGVIIAV
jgi:aminoglycoside phosphotransferase (APT) family kinase protein